MADLNTPLSELPWGDYWNKAKSISSSIASGVNSIMGQPIGQPDNFLSDNPATMGVPSPTAQPAAPAQAPSVSQLGLTPPTPFGLPSATETIPQSPFAVPSPTSQAPTTQEVSPQVTAQDVAGASQESFAQEVRPTSNMIDVEAARTDYDPTAVNTMKTAQTEFDKTQVAIQELMNEASNDPGIKSLLKKQLLNTASIEAMLDPNSDVFKSFTGKVNEAKAKVDESRQDLEKFQKDFQVDPDRYIKEMPALTLALNAVASIMDASAAASAIRAGLTPSPNTTLNRINKAIEQDIGFQREAYLRGEASRKNTINRYADNVKLLGDERLAELKTRMDLNTIIPIQMDQILKNKLASGDIDSKKLEALKAQLALNQAKIDVELRRSTVKSVLATGGGMNPEDQMKIEELKTMKQSKVIRLGGIEGTKEAVARTPEHAKAAEKAAMDATGVLEILNKMEAVYAQMDYLDKVPGTSPDKKKLMESLEAQLLLELKGAYATGALDKGTVDVLEPVVSMPMSKEFRSTFKEKVNIMKKGILGKTAAIYNNAVVDQKADGIDKGRLALLLAPTDYTKMKYEDLVGDVKPMSDEELKKAREQFTAGMTAKN